MHEKETKVNLLVSAKKEFMEKGYIKASLRNICKNAGVTTGALYFFFQGKEDLFASLVEEPLNNLYKIMNEHYQKELYYAEVKGIKIEDFSDDLETAKQIIHYIYQNHDIFLLLLTKAHGSKFESCIDQFVEITENHYNLFIKRAFKHVKAEKLDTYIIHWFAHMHTDIFVHMLTHEQSEKAALEHIESIIKYLILGWNGMFQ